MNKKINLVLFILISVNIAVAQNINNVELKPNRIIKMSDIVGVEFQKAYYSFKNNGFLKLPIKYDRNFMAYLRSKNFRIRPYPYRDSNSPFYVNVNRFDKSHNDIETRISHLFDETNGNYILGIITAISGDHNAIKNWLVTFNFSGGLIDYIPIGELLGNRIRTIEAQINVDFTVDVQQLVFPENDYIIEGTVPVNNLKGQRVDSSFKITADGKFQKLSEVRFLPQVYSPATLLDKKVGIAQRGEKKSVN